MVAAFAQDCLNDSTAYFDLAKLTGVSQGNRKVE